MILKRKLVTGLLLGTTLTGITNNTIFALNNSSVNYSTSDNSSVGYCTSDSSC